MNRNKKITEICDILDGAVNAILGDKIQNPGVILLLEGVAEIRNWNEGMLPITNLRILDDSNIIGETPVDYFLKDIEGIGVATAILVYRMNRLIISGVDDRALALLRKDAVKVLSAWKKLGSGR